MKQAIILAAGEGLRLRPFTVNKPKAMISIAGKPVIQYVLEALAANGIRDIILIVGHQKEQIFDYIGDGKQFGVEVKYIPQEHLLGTGHALAQAEGSTDEEFLVLAGNKLIKAETIAQIVKREPPGILIKSVKDPSGYGMIVLKEGKIAGIVEKPAHPESNYINTGIYAFNKQLFRYLRSELGLPEAINQMLARGENMNVVETDQTWLDIVYPWDILTLNALLLQGIKSYQNGTIEAGVHLQGNVLIGQDTLIRSNSYIIGPVVIGKGCEIGPNVCIFSSTSIGDNVTIGSSGEIKNSVIEADVYINSQSLVQDSVIDCGCVIGAQFSAISEEADVRIDHEYHRVKTGAMLGRSCRIGSAVTAQAGTIIGNYCQIKPLKLVSGTLDDRSLVI
jgi:UDP-N-acetylglucosamine diphosphorylase / glucose-1-phosphate thymidylyltransferase / UDP-N-acetylgalactosamine diphosphorylase / glucosamine-1-phosphate N-acetyltransferase / galactosamine-1-phosphate N-acetyltransferase